MTSTELKHMVRRLGEAADSDDEATVVVDGTLIRGPVSSNVEDGDDMTYIVGDELPKAYINVTYEGDGDWVSDPEGMSAMTTVEFEGDEWIDGGVLEAVNVWNHNLPDKTIYEVDETKDHTDDIREEMQDRIDKMVQARHELQTFITLEQDLVDGRITLAEAAEKGERLELENGGTLALDEIN